MTVYTESEHWCEDRQGNVVIVIIQNLGWNQKTQCYVTRFLFDGRYYEHRFHSIFENMSTCPQPDVRLGSDIAALEGLGLFYGDPTEEQSGASSGDGGLSGAPTSSGELN